jgi:hypothetical protein
MDPTMEEWVRAVRATDPDYDGKRHCSMPNCGSEVIEPGRDVGMVGQTQSGGPPTRVQGFLSKCKKNGHPVRW